MFCGKVTRKARLDFLRNVHKNEKMPDWIRMWAYRSRAEIVLQIERTKKNRLLLQQARIEARCATWQEKKNDAIRTETGVIQTLGPDDIQTRVKTHWRSTFLVNVKDYTREYNKAAAELAVKTEAISNVSTTIVRIEGKLEHMNLDGLDEDTEAENLFGDINEDFVPQTAAQQVSAPGPQQQLAVQQENDAYNALNASRSTSSAEDDKLIETLLASMGAFNKKGTANKSAGAKNSAIMEVEGDDDEEEFVVHSRVGEKNRLYTNLNKLN